MIFSYRSTLVNRETNKAKNLLTPIDTDRWLEVLREDKFGLYGNSAALIEQNILPLLQTEKYDEIFQAVNHYDQQWYERNKLIIFELAMYVWAGFKAGKFTADTWATVFSIAWQSGSRGMMAGVKLTQAQVLEFFKAAPRSRIHKMAEFDDEDLNAEYDSLPESFVVYRGISTGIDHYENGFSWTRDAEEVMKFAALNCHSRKEIPGVVQALIRKEAVLALFSYEGEVVVDPTVKKLEIGTYFLRGKELRDFHKNVDVEANSQDIVFNTGYQAKRLAANSLDASPNYMSDALQS
jgi:hypothetical protein